MKKPLGIKVIIAIHLLMGIAILVVAAFMISSYDPDDKVIFFASLIPITLIMLIYFAAVYGLWTMKKWGPNVSKWIYILGAFFSLFALIKPLLSSNPINMSDILENILGLMVTIAVARYLSRKSIKDMYQN